MTALTAVCSKVKVLYKPDNSFYLHEKIKEITRIFNKKHVASLKDEQTSLVKLFIIT